MRAGEPTNECDMCLREIPEESGGLCDRCVMEPIDAMNAEWWEGEAS